MSGYRQLTERQRYQIELYTQVAGMTAAEVARHLGIHRSTVGRELKRNRNRYGVYRADVAQRKAVARRRGKRHARIPDRLWRQAEVLLRRCWSPEQVSRRLRREGRGRVSHASIYRHVERDRAGGGDLHRFLRCRKRRRRRYGRGAKAGTIRNRVPIARRPAVVEERSRLGDWEADSIVGARQQGALVSLTERRSRLVQLARVARRTAARVSAAVIGRLRPLPGAVLTITSDNGTEFARHEAMARALGTDFYFADPYAAWQRGANENANGLVRQFFPKGSDLRQVSDEELERVMELLNNRPRRCLDWKTPNEVFYGPRAPQVRVWRARLEDELR